YGYAQARTPNLDALARRGLRFEEALASVPLTLPSHATLLSGLEPPHHGVHDNGTYVFPPDRDTLAGLLKAQGYATGAFVAAYVLDRRFGLARGFDLYDDRIERRSEGGSVLESERSCDAVVEAARSWIGQQQGPFLAWLHFYEPHAPYDPVSPYGEASPGRPYDGEVAHADACFGRALATAEARARGKLVVVVVGDHGEGLGDHGERTHGFFIYQSTLKVPFLLSAPGVRAEARAGPVRTADLVPTLLGLVAPPAAKPPSFDGTDLLAGPSPREAYAETVYPQTLGWAPLHAFRSGSLKLIEAPRPELFDLASDPAETRDLSAERPREVERLRAALQALRSGERASARAADAETAERLRALGYVGAAAPVIASGPSKDPKDALVLWTAFEEALGAEARGDREAAIRGLRALLAREPGNVSFRRSLSTALRKGGRLAEAVAVLGPDDDRDPVAAHERAVALAEAGRVAEAIVAEQKAIALNPLLPEPLNHLGVLEARQGRLPEALGAFERALELDPNNAQAWCNKGNALQGLGRPGEAASAYRMALNLAPRSVDARNGLGVQAVAAGDLALAARLFREVLEIQPAHVDAALNLAVVEAQSGQSIAARARLIALLRTNPEPGVRRKAEGLLAVLGTRP
ncbi:MAG TPA: sulfatase-like hydrolase/transferase, partial [Vicinamibacteria bacterium]|nr:sulfatase-like hydrolase/transferase [Vicinamibacteria bacterium]